MELIAANLTPFDSDGVLDRSGLTRHVEWMRNRGVTGFAPTGSTGEFLYLTLEERLAVHATVIAAADGAFVMPCVWDPRPEGCIALARAAEKAGAQAVFLPPPLYHPVGDAGVFDWYDTVRIGVDLPVYAYHHPRTHNPISLELMHSLFEVGIAGLKDSSGDLERVRALADAFPGKIYASDHFIGVADACGEIRGHISRMVNLYPELSRRVLTGETERAEFDARDRAIRRAGGIAAMKRHLGFWGRTPLHHFDDEALPGMPPHSFPDRH